jgi:hypothetical protein
MYVPPDGGRGRFVATGNARVDALMPDRWRPRQQPCKAHYRCNTPSRAAWATTSVRPVASNFSSSDPTWNFAV